MRMFCLRAGSSRSGAGWSSIAGSKTIFPRILQPSTLIHGLDQAPRHINLLRAISFAAMCLVLAACNPDAVGSSAGHDQTQPARARTAAASPQSQRSKAHAHESSEASSKASSEHHGAHDETRAAKRAIHLNKAQRKRLQLHVGKAQSGSATAVIKAPATVAFDADRVARVGPRLQAKTLEVTADLGDKVAAGDTVAILDSAALGRAKAAYLTAAARHETARAEYRRYRALEKKKYVSQSRLLAEKAGYIQARAERNAARAELRLYGLDASAIASISAGGKVPLSHYVLTSPIAGTIQRRDLVRGQTVKADQTPIHVVDNRRMWVLIDAYEQDVPRLASGQRITLTVRALGDQTFSGTTDWVSSELDEKNRTVRVRAVVPNDRGLLRAGMFGTVRIQTDSTEAFALVPVDAVQNIGEDDVVFVPGDEAGAFRAVTVRTGGEDAGLVEIRSGLQAGDAVVTTGAFDLKSALTAGGRSASHSH